MKRYSLAAIICCISLYALFFSGKAEAGSSYISCYSHAAVVDGELGVIPAGLHELVAKDRLCLLYGSMSEKALKDISSGGKLFSADEVRPDGVEQNSCVLLSSQKVTPVLYRARIESGEPFFLVLKESWHRGWRCRVRTAAGWKAVPRKVYAFGYANGWYIEPKRDGLQGTGPLEIEIQFIPQRLLWVGAAVSILSLAAAGELILRGGIKG